MSDNTTVPWHVGDAGVGRVRVYAGAVPVAMFFTSTDAQLAVEDHNAALHAAWDGDQSAAYTCPFCGAVSHLKSDVKESYCGRCHSFGDGTKPALTFPL